MNNKPLSKEDVLRSSVCKDCIWEEMQHLVNTPMNQVYKAMDEYTRQEAIEFFKWNFNTAAGYINYLKIITERTEDMEKEIDTFENSSMSQRYDLYLESKTREKEK
jgi:hypothetical protein